MALVELQVLLSQRFVPVEHGPLGLISTERRACLRQPRKSLALSLGGPWLEGGPQPAFSSAGAGRAGSLAQFRGRSTSILGRCAMPNTPQPCLVGETGGEFWPSASSYATRTLPGLSGGQGRSST